MAIAEILDGIPPEFPNTERITDQKGNSWIVDRDGKLYLDVEARDCLPPALPPGPEK